MSRTQASEIVKALLLKYEAQVYDPPMGRSFDQCYNLETLQPVQGWLDKLNRIIEELTALGVPLPQPY